MVIKITVKGVQKLRKKFAYMAREIPKGANTVVHDVLFAGRNYAKSIAPRETGALWKAIKFTSNKNASGVLMVERPNRLNNMGQKVPYHLWMHGIGKYDISRKIKSGDPHFMGTTTKWLEKKFPQQMENKIQTILKY